MNDKKIDWEEIHRMVARLGSAIESGWMPSQAEKERILRDRAESLAREENAQDTEELVEVVEFFLLNERYGIETSFVQEVYPLKEYTPLPCVPSFVLGLINVRGRIISVIDFKVLLGLPEKDISDLSTVIIISDGNMEFGILADSIIGVTNIEKGELNEPLPVLPGIHTEFIKRVTRERLAIIDAQKMLEDKSIVVHEEV